MFIFQGPPDLMPPVRSRLLFFYCYIYNHLLFSVGKCVPLPLFKGKKGIVPASSIYVLGVNWFCRNFLSCVSLLQIIVIFIFGMINAFSKLINVAFSYHLSKCSLNSSILYI